MAQPSFPASNAIIYLTYGAFLYVYVLLFHVLFQILMLTMIAYGSVSLVFTLHGVGDISPSHNSLPATGRRRVR